MWVYEKRLQYPVNITQTNAKLAQVIISQFGGPDGELAASQRYLSQRYTMPDGMTKGLLNDIGTEEYSRQLLRLNVDILPYLILHTIQNILHDHKFDLSHIKQFYYLIIVTIPLLLVSSCSFPCAIKEVKEVIIRSALHSNLLCFLDYHWLFVKNQYFQFPQ